jgi:hypothetical protein
MRMAGGRRQQFVATTAARDQLEHRPASDREGRLRRARRESCPVARAFLEGRAQRRRRRLLLHWPCTPSFTSFRSRGRRKSTVGMRGRKVPDLDLLVAHRHQQLLGSPSVWLPSRRSTGLTMLHCGCRHDGAVHGLMVDLPFGGLGLGRRMLDFVALAICAVSAP